MEVEALENAIAEAERFIEVAKKVEIVPALFPFVREYTKESAACRRASLDLTRALAELRK